ncbi:bile acid:sodium symporter family protein [Ruficoccus sp. ZRK36]|uniref:bile acid:sodium symporter family protein n=1 Tax=Ruficoccus sp. ZRK36 TaxID=2866311 RepID=UPI001C734EAE|nr:bile acid:sodium symporter family protein [Ruficoccus sp. ZRK36]QYY37200.1 bile acid:sodium symporter [Ruficoccus sp. ZRK36]
MLTSWLKRTHIDGFLIVLIGAVVLASFLPAHGVGDTIFRHLTTAAIALLFFMHGAKLPRQALIGGLGHWRLHLTIFASTFILFPLLGLGMQLFVPHPMHEDIYLGFLYLCALPATVQSAIAFTSIGGGNIPAAVCSASASSILGIFLSPILVGLLMETQEGGSGDTLGAIRAICLQLMLPFVIGHLCRPLLKGLIHRYKKAINITDRSSIVLVVYTAFSEAVVGGIWKQIDLFSIGMIVLFSCVLLAVVLFINIHAARLLGFGKEDEITIVFCGSKKSLANGVPMANVLFPPAAVGLMVLPLMIFHQIQLMVCAVMAARYAKRLEKP